MAIYSFNHDTFGKSQSRARGNTPYAAARNAAYNARETATRYSQQDGTAASNAAYNVREEVTYAARSFGMPTAPQEVEAWFREQERNDRKNARMSDRFIGALPRELTPDQQLEAVEGFCRDVTANRVPWHFGLHLELEQQGKPDWNPHAHIIFRDRDIETGKRYLNTSAGPKERRQLAEKGLTAWSTADFRQAWEAHMNAALEKAGHDIRIDARSNASRGIEAEPTIHTGRGAQRLVEKGQRPLSNTDYIAIDNGQTRVDENERRKRRRSERPPPDTPEQRQRQALNERHGEQRSNLAAQQHAERLALRSLHAAEFASRTHQEKLHHREQRNEAYADIGQQFTAKYQAVKRMPDDAARAQAIVALTAEQTVAYEVRSKQLVANAAPAKDTRWREMKAAQAAERLELEANQRQQAEALKLAQDAERLALKERQRLARETAHAITGGAAQSLRDSVALSGSQRMVNVEAVQMERMRRRAEQADRQRDTAAKTANHEAKAAAARERLQNLRGMTAAMKEATDRRQQLAAKDADRTAEPHAKKKKGKGEQEQER